jgi:hypothetical protein
VRTPGKKASRSSVGYCNADRHPAWLIRSGRSSSRDSCLKKSDCNLGLSIHNEFSFTSPLLEKTMFVTCGAFYALKSVFTCSKSVFVWNAQRTGGFRNAA